LRASLYYVTDHPGSVVKFNIPASDAGYSNGVFNIHLSGHLPPLASNAMVMDGSTQPGFTSKPLIVVDGSQIIPETFTSNSGLLIYSASNQVKDISFQGFNWNGLTLEYADATNNTIAGCWLGLDSTGSNAAPNAYQGILFAQGAGGNIIGGTNVLARNVLSGNSQYGLWMSDTNTTDNVILGNYIGTDASGSLAVPNGLGGIGIFYNGVGHVIGGTNADGRNVISGNGGAGIWLSGTGVSNNIVGGNLIGLNAAGTAGVSNAYGTGVIVAGGASGNAILNNVISSNYIGVLISDLGTRGNAIQGNLIGTDTTGKTALPNGYEGLALQGGAASNTIGGTGAGSANTISGNYYNLAIFDPGTSGNVIQGNLVGVDITGKTALPGQYQGVAMGNGATSNIIGGTVAGAGNIISGNYLGLVIGNTNTSGNLFQGNLIGTDITGSNALGNSFADVQLYGGASGNVIGGVAPGAGNTIAFSGFGPGVVLYDAGTTRNAIRGNSIFSNGGLGIDLNNDGVTPNHTGFLAGPNNLQNFPVITNAFGYAASTIIQGILNSTANGSFLIDVYRNIAADPSGYGEGQFYVGTVSVTTDASGNAAFALTNTAGNYAGQYFAATAASSGGDTSEFGMDVVGTNQTAPSALFSGPFVANTSGFSFTLTLQTNFSYRIQATTNLGATPIPWVDLTNFTPSTSLLIFTDRTATNYGTRFYRVISP
jgi:titin